MSEPTVYNEIQNYITTQKPYGNLLIINYDGSTYNKRTNHYVSIRCLLCGNERHNINYAYIKRGRYKGCGCLLGESIKSKIDSHIKNNTKFGKLRIIKYDGMESRRFPLMSRNSKGLTYNSSRLHFVTVQCDCGNIKEHVLFNGNIDRGECVSCGCSFGSSSNAEQNLAKFLVEYYGEHRVKSSITQNMKQLELLYFNETFNEQRKFLYDIVIDDKYIIEYNGIAFHPKSKDDKSWKHPFNKSIDAKTAWEHDQLKKQVATSNGYFILEVWEDENIEESVRKIISFVSNNPQ